MHCISRNSSRYSVDEIKEEVAHAPFRTRSMSNLPI